MPNLEFSTDEVRTLIEALHTYAYNQRVLGSEIRKGPAWESAMDRVGEAQTLIERLNAVI